MVKIVVDPFTRMSSGLRFYMEMTDGSVTDARCSGTSYRGFEQMLVGRDPMDAAYFTQRVCGMCSVSQATAAAGAIESVCEATGSIPKDALVVRNILNGLEWLRNHIASLYLAFLPDLNDQYYVNLLQYSDTGTALIGELAGRFSLPGYGSGMTAAGSAYTDAVQCIKLIGDTEAILSGRSPHTPAIVPGGVTARPTASDLYRLKANYNAIVEFLERRLTAPLTLDQWLDSTHTTSPAMPDPNFIVNQASALPKKNLSAGSGWNDLMLFAVFGSMMMSEQFLSLSAYIELDTLGGYPLKDSLIGYLNNGAFFRVRDGSNNFRDGYAPVDSDKTSSFQFYSGFTPGGMANLMAAAGRADPSLITEQVSNSFYTYAGGKASLAPESGETSPLTGRADIDYAGQKYSFVKAPRYGGVPCEVGPMARMINTREPFISNIMRMLHDNSALSQDTGETYQMTGVYTRILARMQEMLIVAGMLGDWINNDLEVHDDPRKYCIPVAAGAGRSGACLIDAPRGALGHWVQLDGSGRIARYQIIAPTTWNASPRDSSTNYGPMELATIGTRTTPRGNLPGSEAFPLSLYHIVRSFDPCVSCAVHTIRNSGLSSRYAVSSAIRGKR